MPLWLDDLDVREALAAGTGQLTSREPGDDRVDDPEERRRQARPGWLPLGGAGRDELVQVPGLGLEADDVTSSAERTASPSRLTVDYGRTVKLKPLEQYWTLKFHTSKEATLRP